MFHIQPEDGLYQAPKHVVVLYVINNIYMCIHQIVVLYVINNIYIYIYMCVCVCVCVHHIVVLDSRYTPI